MSKKKKWVLLVTISVLAAILLVAAGFLFYYGWILKDTLKKVTTVEGTQTVFAVYVLQEDEAQVVGDTAAYTYGVYQNDADAEEREQAITRLEEGLGQRPAMTEYEDVFTLVNGLREQTCQAVLLNEAYLESLAEVEGYEWTQDGLRKLESFAFDAQEETIPTTPVNLPETFVMYISGIDTYGGLSARSRSDVNILAVVNTRTKKIGLVATPRDYYVEFSATKGEKDKLTHAGIYGVENSIDALERLYDLEIDYYLRLNFSGFVNIIDALGGVEVYSEYDFSVKSGQEYHKGYNQLNGTQALAFARERYSFRNGDYQRAKNQMEVIRAVIQKCASTAVLKNYESVMNAIAGSFETNMPEDQVLALIRMQLSDKSQWDISSYTVDGTSAYEQTYSMPGHNLYVILPNQQSVDEVKSRIQDIQSAAE